MLLHHLKNSSLFCVCVETAGLPKLSCYLPCATSALHCREQKEQLCYTEFNDLFLSDCRGTEHSVHSRLCLQPSLAAAREKTQFICQTNLLQFWALFKSSHKGSAFGKLVKSAVQEALEIQIYSLWGNH